MSGPLYGHQDYLDAVERMGEMELGYRALLKDRAALLRSALEWWSWKHPGTIEPLWVTAARANLGRDALLPPASPPEPEGLRASAFFDPETRALAGPAASLPEPLESPVRPRAEESGAEGLGGEASVQDSTGVLRENMGKMGRDLLGSIEDDLWAPPAPPEEALEEVCEHDLPVGMCLACYPPVRPEPVEEP